MAASLTETFCGTWCIACHAATEPATAAATTEAMADEASAARDNLGLLLGL